MVINTNNDLICKVMGISEQSVELLELISEVAPINQIELTSKILSNKLKKPNVSKDLIDKKKPGIHRKCWTLYKKELIIDEPKSVKKRYYCIHEKTFEDLREYLSHIENNVLINILLNIPENIVPKDEEIEVDSYFKNEEELYNKGEMSSAIKELLKHDDKKLKKLPLSFESRRQRLLGWSYYHKGLKEKKEKNKILNGEKSRRAFNRVLRIGSSLDIDSALNGLILTYEYLLQQHDKALIVAEKAINQTNNKDLKVRSLNAIGLIEKHKGNFKKAIESFDETIIIAKEIGDLRTAAHATNNKARILMELIGLIPFNEKYKSNVEALFLEAISLYSKSKEETGKDVKFHVDGVEKKLKELKKK